MSGDRSSTGPIYIAGHRGLVGSALVRRLTAAGRADELVLRSRAELDLTDAAEVNAFFAAQRPAYVVLAAAKVGGILANDTWPVPFLHDNLAIELNVLAAAHRHGVRRLLFLGSSCIYPRDAPQPIREEHLLTGELEPTNRAYAVAKIAGIELCRAYNKQHGTSYLALMPSNLYGPGDCFDLARSHVLPALVRKVFEARERGERRVTVWGTGRPRREFLHVDDLADACVRLLGADVDWDLVNIGVGADVSIRELAELVRDVLGYDGELVFDPTKPDGTPRKLLDVSRMHSLGWQPRIPLRAGIAETVNWYRDTAGGAVVTGPATTPTRVEEATGVGG